MSLLNIDFNLPFERVAEELAKRKIVLPNEYYSSLEKLHRQLSFSIAGVASLDQLQLILDSLTDSVANGTTFAEWQKNVDVKSLGLPKHRLDNIYRTNLQNAYNRGRWEHFQQNKETFPFLQYDAINDSRVRPSHLAMDGLIREIDSSFWATHYPPNGFRCRCRVIALTKTQADRRSKDGTGLNQQIDLEKMKPDKGWDYNVGQDLTKGINNVINDRVESKTINEKLKDSFKKIIGWFSG